MDNNKKSFESKKNNYFYAIANCNISVNVNKIKEVRELNEKRIDELNRLNGTTLTTLPVTASMYSFSKGQVYKFGDYAEVNEFGNLEVIPKEYYEGLAGRTIELPTPVLGDISQAFSGMGNLPPELVDDFVRNNKKLTESRFVILPILEKIEKRNG